MTAKARQGPDFRRRIRPPMAFAPPPSLMKMAANRPSDRLLTGPGLVFSHPIRFHCTPLVSPLIPLSFTHAIVAIFSTDPERKSERGGDCLASADAARGHDTAGGGRHLRLAAARLSGAEEDRADRARGAGPRRRAGIADADVAARRPLARERPLRRLWSGDAAHHRPPQARIAVWSDQ